MTGGKWIKNGGVNEIGSLVKKNNIMNEINAQKKQRLGYFFLNYDPAFFVCIRREREGKGKKPRCLRVFDQVCFNLFLEDSAGKKLKALEVSEWKR